MSSSALRVLAGSGAKDDPVYVDDVFSTFLYGGTGSAQTITNDIDLDGEGGLVWIKNRDSAVQSHALFDTERGVRYHLASNTNGASTDYGAYGVDSFNSNGFSLIGNGGATNGSDDYVSWTFRKQPGFFDIVTYTGDGNSGRTVNHSLESVPGMIIVKRTDTSANWPVYHRSLTTGQNAYLNLDASGANYSGIDFDNVTSTSFDVGNDTEINASGGTYVAYLFAHDAQDFGEDSDEAIIKCGTYTGNSGSQTIPVGFEAQWVLIKNITSGSTDWFMVDVMRGIPDTTSYDASLIRANEADAEQTSGAGGARITAKNTGFGFLTESNLSCNRSGETYIYVAIRRPHKPASEFAATKLFNVDAGANTTPGFDTGFPVDMGIFRVASSTGDFDIMSRRTGLRRLDFPSAGAEANKGTMAQMDHMDGWSTNANTYTGWAWRRAPGYFDVTTHESNGQPTQQITHNLGVAPEMVWIKMRSLTSDWFVYHKDLTSGKNLKLNQTAAEQTSNSTTAATFTSTYWTPGDNGYDSGGSNTQTYIAYLFATVSGISKVGSYTGTGSAIDVDCGFSNGARFVLIKRIDDAASWYLFDSVRGIVAGNDPKLSPDTTAAQYSSIDYIDPLSSGFTVGTAGGSELNTSGGTYIFYAIA